jgi:AcrR family transcriptional regulator
MAVESGARNLRAQAAADARTRILDAAVDCIVRDGLAQVRMASIARTAGVSAGLLHYHFDTKELLFAEVLSYSHAASSELNDRALEVAGDGPAERLSSFLDRCLPSDEQRAHEWLLWQELALLCIRDPHLAKVGADLYEDLYVTIADIVRDGVAAGVFATTLDPRALAETAVALTDGLGERVLANDPNLGLEQARTTIATMVGILVGHDGPLP